MMLKIFYFHILFIIKFDYIYVLMDDCHSNNIPKLKKKNLKKKKLNHASAMECLVFLIIIIMIIINLKWYTLF